MEVEPASFTAAFDTLRDLQKTQYEALREDISDVKADIKQLNTWRGETDQLLDGIRTLVDIGNKIASPKTLVIFGSGFSVVTFVVTWLARLF
jgi:prefoldin subunit 5